MTNLVIAVGGLFGKMIQNSVIRAAVDAALKSTHKQKHGAVVFKGKKIYSTGFNHPFRSIKSVKPNSQKWRTSVHAEVSAILNAKRDVSGYDMLVVRINDKGQFMLSKPCINCLNYLDYCDIRNIYYSVVPYPFIERL
jgi:deoxycytidylate deaminase